MSVTLRLSDEDAAVIGSLLNAVAEQPTATSTDSNEYKVWFQRVRHAHTGRDAQKLREIAGAFSVAVRANKR